MKRVAIILVAAAAVAVFFAWPHGGAQPGAQVATASAAAPVAPVAAHVPQPQPQLPEAHAGRKPVTEARRRLLDGVAAQVKHAGKPCVAGRVPEKRAEGPDETMDRVRVRVGAAVEGRVMRVTSAVRASEGFQDEKLEACVLDAIRAARWNAAADATAVDVELEIYVGELMARDGLDEPRRNVPRAPHPAGIPMPTMPPPPMPAPPLPT
jgi:hypothetical protein